SLTDSGGNVAARYLYDPFGKLIGKAGTMADVNRYMFSSKELHPTSGLYYYGFRFFDTGLQRWLNQDPIGEAGGMNLYGFVGNSPLGRMDPLGLANEPEPIPGVSGQIRSLATAASGLLNFFLQGIQDTGKLLFEREPGLLPVSPDYVLALPPPPPVVAETLPERSPLDLMFMAAGMLGPDLLGAGSKVPCKTGAAAETTAAAGDHIVLGLEAHGLEQTATQVGGRTLMTDANWQTTLQTSLGNPSTRFTVS